MSNESITELISFRSLIKEGASEERTRVANGKKPYSAYDSPLESYVDSFKDVLPTDGIVEYLSRLTNEKRRSLRALDIAGQGRALLEFKDFGINLVVTAITLVDFRKDQERVNDKSRGLKVVDGDIFIGSTWTAIKDTFDLITCRPVIALLQLNNPVIAFALLDKMYQKLDPGGILLTELPPLVGKVGQGWIERLKETTGLIVKCDLGSGLYGLTDDKQIPALSIIRTKSAPPNLKFLKEV